MPKILGLEPHSWKPIALIGGGGLILFLVLRGRGTPAIAAEAPSAGAPMPAGVISPAAQPELSQGAQAATALQTQLQQAQLTYDIGASNLALQSQAQQLKFQGQAAQQQLSHQTELNYYNEKLAHEQLRTAQGRNTPWYQSFGQAASALNGVFQLGFGAYKQVNPTKTPTQGQS